MPTTYKLLGQSTPGTTRTFAAVSNKAITASVATVTTAANHGFSAGDIVVIAGVDTTFDGTRTIATVPTTTTFTFASSTATVASAAVTPNATVYRTHNLGGVASANKFSTGTNAIITTGSAHGLTAGDWAYVQVGDSNMDGLVKVLSAPTTTTFSYAKGGSAVVSTAVTIGAVGRALPTTWTQLYQVPSATSTVLSTIVAANLNPISTQIRIAIATGTTPTLNEIIIYDSFISANDTLTLTLGLTLPAAERILVNANQPEVSFSAYGAEIS